MPDDCYPEAHSKICMRFILSEASERQTSMKTNNCHLDLTMKNVWENYT